MTDNIETLLKESRLYRPSARTTADASPASAPSDRKKPKDLRRLSEWIKMMRELEARKQSDE